MGEHRLQVGEGVLGLLAQANTRKAGYGIVVGDGDLCQMAAQGRFLRERGMDIGNIDVYPAVRTREEELQALRLMWEGRVDGWWNLRERFVREGICTADEAADALHHEVEMEKKYGPRR